MSKASKSQKKLKEEHKWYDRITGELTKERKFDRSWQSEELLKRTKKIKLAIKDKIENIKK
tara:strand:- start:4110 stop:4292 length:183 start_codon:yes stop_codon:yes gene_type:complete